MEEQLQKAVAALIEKGLLVLDQGATFLSGELPDVVSQLMIWHATKSAILTAFGVILIVIWLIVDVKAFNKALEVSKKEHDYFYLGMIWGVAGSIPRGIFAATVLSLMSLTWLQIWIAPKVWLIEYAVKSVGGK